MIARKEVKEMRTGNSTETISLLSFGITETKLLKTENDFSKYLEKEEAFNGRSKKSGEYKGIEEKKNEISDTKERDGLNNKENFKTEAKEKSIGNKDNSKDDKNEDYENVFMQAPYLIISKEKITDMFISEKNLDNEVIIEGLSAEINKSEISILETKGSFPEHLSFLEDMKIAPEISVEEIAEKQTKGIGHMINGLEVNQYDNPKASKEKEMKISMDQLVEYGAENSDDKAITDLVQKTKNDIDYFSGNKKDEKAGFDINPIDSKGIIEIKDIKIDRNDNSFESFKETELNTRNIISQISENIITGKTDEGSFLQMKLKPENLGELTIKITESELGLAANIIAEKEDVKNILNKNSEELLALLSEKNIKINSITVESKDSFDFGNSTQDSGFSNQSFSEKREQNNYSQSNMIGEKQIEDGGSEAKNASRKNHEENTLNIYV
jgi:hypothetical protein